MSGGAADFKAATSLDEDPEAAQRNSPPQHDTGSASPIPETDTTRRSVIWRRTCFLIHSLLCTPRTKLSEMAPIASLAVGPSANRHYHPHLHNNSSCQNQDRSLHHNHNRYHRALLWRTLRAPHQARRLIWVLPEQFRHCSWSDHQIEVDQLLQLLR